MGILRLRTLRRATKVWWWFAATTALKPKKGNSAPPSKVSFQPTHSILARAQYPFGGAGGGGVGWAFCIFCGCLIAVLYFSILTLNIQGLLFLLLFLNNNIFFASAVCFFQCGISATESEPNSFVSPTPLIPQVDLKAELIARAPETAEPQREVRTRRSCLFF